MPRGLAIKPLLTLTLLLAVGWSSPLVAQPPRPMQRLVLLAQGPDGSHPPGTHEYRRGLETLQQALREQSRLRSEVLLVDDQWPSAAEQIQRADGVVLYVAEGAKWLTKPRHLDALTRAASRGAGLVVIHWGMGTRTAEPIEPFVQLFGACHGGPDRKYKVLRTTLQPSKHPAVRGIAALEVRDEFYYQLKTPAAGKAPAALPTATIDGQPQMVAWAWERPDGGRSAGFSGLHFHDNWRLEPYRRLLAQSVLWTLRRKIPPDGVRLPSAAK